MMQGWYSYTHEVLQQGSNLGFAREHFVKNILMGLLPNTVIAGSGEIIDGFGNRSGQQDIIIYRSDFPVITSLTPVNTYLVEGVVATIEIKSNLSTGAPHLHAAFKNIQRVLSLSKAAQIISGDSTEVNKLQELSSIKTYVIGYSGWQSKDSLLKNYFNAGIKTGWNYLPHLIYQPGACILRNDGFLNPDTDDEKSGLLLQEDNPFSVFLHHLLKSILLSTNSLIVQASGVEAQMNYDLNPYFNFNPPLKFQRLEFKRENQAEI